MGAAQFRERGRSEQPGPAVPDDIIECRSDEPPPAADANWNDRRNGTARTFDMVNVPSARVLDFEIAQRANALGRGNHQGTINRMDLEALGRMVNGWEDNQKVPVAVKDHESRKGSGFANPAGPSGTNLT